MACVPVKYTFNGSLRRANVPVPLRLQNLDKQIRDSFPKLTPNDTLTMSYVDEEGDTVVVASDHELEVAQGYFRDLGKILMLKFELSESETKTPSTPLTPLASNQASVSATSQASKSQLAAEKQLKQLQQKKLVRNQRIQARKERREELKKLREAAAAARRTAAATTSASATAAATTAAATATKPQPQQPHQKPHPAIGTTWILSPYTNVSVRAPGYPANTRGVVQYYDAARNTYIVRLNAPFNYNATFQPNLIYAVDSARPGCFAQQFSHGRGRNNKLGNARSFAPPIAPIRAPAPTRGQTDCATERHIHGVIGAAVCFVIPTLLFGLWGLFAGMVIACFIGHNCNKNKKKKQCSRRPTTRRRVTRRNCPKLSPAEKLYRMENHPFTEALPFIQLFALFLAWAFGSCFFSGFVWTTSIGALCLKAARVINACHQKGKPCCMDKLCQRFRRLDNSSRACNGAGPSRKQLGCLFGGLLVGSIVLGIVLSFPTPIYWCAHFILPRVPKPTSTTTTTTTTSTSTAARTTPAVSTSTAQTKATSGSGAKLNQILADIQKAPVHRRGHLSDALHRDLAAKDANFSRVTRMLRRSK